MPANPARIEPKQDPPTAAELASKLGFVGIQTENMGLVFVQPQDIAVIAPNTPTFEVFVRGLGDSLKVIRSTPNWPVENLLSQLADRKGV